MGMPNPIRLPALVVRSLRCSLARRSAPSRGVPVYGVGFALLCTALAAPAWSGEVGGFQTFRGLADFAALPLRSHGDSASDSERITLDEAIALALDANRL